MLEDGIMPSNARHAVSRKLVDGDVGEWKQTVGSMKVCANRIRNGIGFVEIIL